MQNVFPFHSVLKERKLYIYTHTHTNTHTHTHTHIITVIFPVSEIMIVRFIENEAFLVKNSIQ